MKYTMEQIREAFFKGGLNGKVIKFLWFYEKGKKPHKCRARMQWIGSKPERGNFIEISALKVGRHWYGGLQFEMPLREIVILADKGLERSALLGNSLKTTNFDLTLPEENNASDSLIKKGRK